jgi:hypothetical protein
MLKTLDINEMKEDRLKDIHAHKSLDLFNNTLGTLESASLSWAGKQHRTNKWRRQFHISGYSDVMWLEYTLSAHDAIRDMLPILECAEDSGWVCESTYDGKGYREYSCRYPGYSNTILSIKVRLQTLIAVNKLEQADLLK